MTSEEIERKIMEWNATFPLDKWYREKYSIPLFSSKHLDSNQLDILFEFLEIQLFTRVINEAERKQKQVVEEEKREEDFAFESLRKIIKNGEWTGN